MMTSELRASTAIDVEAHGKDSDIEEYGKLCRDRAGHHLRNGLSAKRWDNFLVITGNFFAASAQLVVPLMVVVDASTINIAIASGVLTFMITLVSSMKNSFNFSLLNYQHLHLSEDFKELEAEFSMLGRKGHSVESVELLVAKYGGIAQRAGVQGVSECRIFCCFS
jgi:hypothetical protein